MSDDCSCEETVSNGKLHVCFIEILICELLQYDNMLHNKEDYIYSIAQ